MPVTARASDGASVRSPAASSMPGNVRAASCGLRTRARTAPPRPARVRARWPPVNPVAPVTSTRGVVAAVAVTSGLALGNERDRRADQAGDAEGPQCALAGGGEAARGDSLVERDRQHEM